MNANVERVFQGRKYGKATPSESNAATSDNLQAAFRYAARGWPVLPCRPRGKEPLTPHGCRDATTDAKTIASWWRHWPDANVGLATGPASGLLVLDIDGEAGAESLAALAAEHGPLPETPEALTPGGGRHLYFCHPSGEPVRCAVRLGDWPGLDLRGEGGYVVAPPSTHPTGGRYEWELSSDPVGVPLAEPPAWLLALANERDKPAGNGHSSDPLPEVIAEGQRNATLTSIAGSLRRRGASEATIMAALRTINETQCWPPLPSEEVERIASSVGRYAAAPRRGEGKPNLPPIGVPVVSEVCAADLAAKPAPEVHYLPLLGSPGYIAKGWTTMVAGYPKSGKTELLARLCREWQGESILFVTEEPESIWAARLHRLPGDWRHVHLRFALGMDPADILARIREGQESVVIIDTVRNLLGLQDETDNSEVARVLAPFVATARAGGQTLILLHHVRKGGGEHGEGITGGHAFLGIVDVALEILRESNLGENKRRIRGWGRLFPIEEGVYELAPDGAMSFLGSPKAVELGAVKERVLAVLNGAWRSRKELLEDLEDPKPAIEQLRLALNAMAAEGLVERDPAEERRGATYRYRLAPPKPNLPRTSPMVVSEVAQPASPQPNLPRAPSMVVSEVDNAGPRFAVGSLVYLVDDAGILQAPHHAVQVVDVRANGGGWEYQLAEVGGWRPEHLLEGA